MSNAIRVLVVDDYYTTATKLSELLRTAGYAVESACDWPSAIEATARFKPEVILLDQLMPQMTGVETVILRDASSPAGTLIVVMTVSSGDGRSKVTAAGFDDYLVKPFMLADFKAVIARHSKQAGNLPS